MISRRDLFLRRGPRLGDAEQAYLARTTGREAFKRAVERSHPALAPSTA